jgi:uncharacterized membrane protein
MIAALFVAGLVLLALILIPLVVVNRIFYRLSDLQRQVDALARRVEAGAPSVPVVPKAPETPKVPQAPKVPDVPEVRVRERAAPASTPDVRDSAPELRAANDTESLEALIGSRWLLYIGVIAIVIGAAYFEKLAFENHWVGETARVIQGGVAGLVLIYAGIRFGRAGYTTYGQMISGCGSAILYVSTYAAFNFYHLIDRPVAFGLMAVITAGTAWLADRQRSQGLAVLAVGGGFATPFMLPGTTDAQLALFGYDTVLIGGTVALSRRRDWPLLDVVSYLFTVATVAAWADRFYTPQKFLRTEIFLTIFCAMFLAINHAHRRSTSTAIAIARLLLWTAAPAYYLASLVVLGDHPTAILVWVVCLALTSAILTASTGIVAGFGVWLAALFPLLLWCATHLSRTWFTSGVITVAAVYAVALAAQLFRESERAAFVATDVVWVHLNGLLTFAGAYLLIDAVRSSATAPVAGAFAVWHGLLAAALLDRNRDRALHYGGVALALLMIAIGLQFNGAAVTIGWAAEGAIVIALGLREKRDWMRGGGVALFFVAIVRTVDLLTSPAPVNQTPLFNSHAACGAFVVLMCYALGWLHARGDQSSERSIEVAAALVAAQVVTLMLVTSEVDAYWSAPADALTRELAKSVVWAIYATLLIVIGLGRDYAPIRYFAILLFALTTMKVFFVDMAHLERIYRILSVIGLGIALLVTSYLYQRIRVTPITAEPMTGQGSAPIDDLNGRR